MSSPGLLEGSNDESLLYDLYTQIDQPSNDSQKLFCVVWEVNGFISSCGFEWLFE
jgi:hypothetical protein